MKIGDVVLTLRWVKERYIFLLTRYYECPEDETGFRDALGETGLVNQFSYEKVVTMATKPDLLDSVNLPSMKITFCHKISAYERIFQSRKAQTICHDTNVFSFSIILLSDFQTESLIRTIFNQSVSDASSLSGDRFLLYIVYIYYIAACL